MKRYDQNDDKEKESSESFLREIWDIMSRPSINDANIPSLERWHFWKQHFDEVGLLLGFEIKSTAIKAHAKMTQIEQIHINKMNRIEQTQISHGDMLFD